MNKQTIRAECRAIQSIPEFQEFLRKYGINHLDAGLYDVEVGRALLEIASRAGVKGLGLSDYVYETLPMIAELAYLRHGRGQTYTDIHHDRTRTAEPG